MKIQERIFPPTLNNNYTGNRIAKWMFYLFVIFTIGRSLIHVFAVDGGAQSIATIPLDSYSTGAAASVISIFSFWGLSQLLMGLLYLVVSLRYRNFIPLMYLLMLIEYVGRMIIGELKPIETMGTAPGGVGNYILVPLLIVMLALSLQEKKSS